MKIIAKLTVSFLSVALLVLIAGFVGINAVNKITEQAVVDSAKEQVIGSILHETRNLAKISLADDAVELTQILEEHKQEEKVANMWLNTLMYGTDSSEFKSSDSYKTWVEKGYTAKGWRIKFDPAIAGIAKDIYRYYNTTLMNIKHDTVKTHIEKLSAKEKFVKAYPKEKKKRYHLRELGDETNDRVIIDGIWNIYYLSKEVLYQYNDEKHLNKWLEAISKMRKDAETAGLTNLATHCAEYYTIAENMGRLVIQIKEKDTQETLRATLMEEYTETLKKMTRKFESVINAKTNKIKNQAAFILVAITLITLLLAILIGVFVSHSISRPIMKLKDAAQEIGKGQIGTKIDIETKNEIGDLAASFNRMTKDLRETVVSRDYVDNIVRSMADILVVVTPDGKIEKANRAALDILGYKEAELIGKDVSLLFSEEEGGIPLKGTKLEKLIKEGTLRSYEINYKAKDGRKIPVLLSGAVIKAIDCPHNGPTEDCPSYRKKGEHCEKILSIVCVAKDITERKKTEDELQKAYVKLRETQTQLIQVEKMDAIGKMASGVAHEVKNPLGIILQGINYFEGELSPEEKDNREILQAMKDSIKKADSIVRALLDFSRAGALKIKPEDINSILKNSLALVEHEVKLKDIEIIKELGKDLPKVRADKGKIEQVFVNLLLNAIHAMSKDGKLHVRTYLSQLNKLGGRIGNKATDYFKPNEKVIIVEIEDTGVGIAKENMDKIFDPFFTTKGRTEGTGLGLSVTKTMVEMHKGLINIESERGKGTKVIIALKQNL